MVAPESGTQPLALTVESGIFFYKSIFKIYLLIIYVTAPGLCCGTRDLLTLLLHVCGIFTCGKWDLVP